LTLKCDKLLSSVGSNFNLRRYIKEHAEGRAKLAGEQLAKFRTASDGDKAALREKVSEAETRVALHGPEAWETARKELAEANDKLKRARADVKRLQALVPGGKNGEELKLEQAKAGASLRIHHSTQISQPRHTYAPKSAILDTPIYQISQH
jgi:hypothetical protein